MQTSSPALKWVSEEEEEDAAVTPALTTCELWGMRRTPKLILDSFILLNLIRAFEKNSTLRIKIEGYDYTTNDEDTDEYKRYRNACTIVDAAAQVRFLDAV